MDGLWAVTRSDDADLILWNVHQGTPVHQWKWSDARHGAVISPDSQLVTGSVEKNHLLVYNLRSPASPPMKLILLTNSSSQHGADDKLDGRDEEWIGDDANSDDFGAQVDSIACLWSDDGTQLVVLITTHWQWQRHHDVLLLFDRPDFRRSIFMPKRMNRDANYQSRIHMHNANQSLAAWDPTGSDRGYQVWDLVHGSLHYQLFPSHWPKDSLHFRKHYAIYCDFDEHTNSTTIEVFDMRSRLAIPPLTLASNFKDFEGIPISTNGTHISIVLEEGTVQTWELATQTKIHSFQDPYLMVSELGYAVFSPDTLHVLLRYRGKSMRLLRVADGVCLATFAPRSRPKHVQFSGDGKTLCYTTDDGHVVFEPIGHLL